MFGRRLRVTHYRTDGPSKYSSRQDAYGMHLWHTRDKSQKKSWTLDVYFRQHIWAFWIEPKND